MKTMDFANEPKVVFWKQTVEKAGCTIKKLVPLSLLHKKSGELLFALCDSTVIDPHGASLPGYIFIRGSACIIVPLIRNSTTQEERFCMILQRRIGNGAENLEFPAGMLDRQIEAIEQVALSELREETGIIIQAHDLRPLHNGPLYSSPGASDEGIYYFGCIISLEDSEYKSLEGKRCGNKSENENITVTLCTREEAETKTISLQARLGLCLFTEYLKKTRRA